MRVLIDLQCCQAADQPHALALACDMVRSAGAHEVWIALSDRYPASIDKLRLAFVGLLPRERVRVCALPAAGAGARWPVGAAELVRENFLAALDADAVFVPHAAPRGELVLAVSQAAPFASVFGALDADAAAAWRQLEEAQAARRPHSMPARPRLAYISPLPPEKSGIADYSAELAPQLARFYDVELIVDQQTVDHERLGGLPVRKLDWFEQHADEFERVLYHFGNSHAHQHMFELIRRHPGIVVLHDFYFSGVLDNIERDGYLPQGFLRALYESHGYTGLLEHAKNGRNPAIWKYPLNKGVLDNATGVIVHSEFSKQLAADWYGPDAARNWRTVPLLRGKPEVADAGALRRAARGRLGIAAQDFVVCSFGMLGKTKLNEELLDAFLSSPLAQDPHCRLVFVGENEGGLYGAGLNRRAGEGRVAITGFVNATQYADYLAACDCAVQLRASTRGETSASVLDCLLYGVPTIVNAHGSSAALSDELLIKLRDNFNCAELAGALVRLHREPELRAGLSQRALAHMQAEHAPAHVGELMRDAIEQFTAHSAHAHYKTLLAAIARLPAPSAAADAQLATAIACNQPPSAPRQLLVDVSAVVQADIKTGIQRVVRSVLLALIADPPPGYRIEPVFSTGGNRSYHYARGFTLGMVGETGLALEDAPVDLRPGDIFLGLDLFTNGTSQNEKLLQSMRERGVLVYFVMFDLLPVLRPDVFPFGTEQHFSAFLHTVSAVADGLLCISRAVADELAEWIARQPQRRVAPLQIGYFHLGADIDASVPSYGLPPNAEQVFAAVGARPSFLMVGTVEPRKAHAQALAAFELLWERGVDINLVIVGKAGWMVEKLVERMAAHPEKERRLFWLPGVSDEMLLKLYASSSALLAVSEGEGFGLPLIEAAQHNIPIIVRSLPVFREVAGEHAYYFDGVAPDDLARTIAAWLQLWRDGKAPTSTGMPSLTWSQSARQVLDNIERQQWYKQLPEHDKK